MVNHYQNLTRGKLCHHFKEGRIQPVDVRTLRVQSTHCEQKQWGRILETVGADLLYALTQGTFCIVHDVSEKDRETRACWQGLSWIRYACQRAWEVEPKQEFSRGGVILNPYWEEQWKGLDRKVRHAVIYYNQFRFPWVTYPQLYSCRRLMAWIPSSASSSSEGVRPTSGSGGPLIRASVPDAHPIGG